MTFESSAEYTSYFVQFQLRKELTSLKIMWWQLLSFPSKSPRSIHQIRAFFFSMRVLIKFSYSFDPIDVKNWFQPAFKKKNFHWNSNGWEHLRSPSLICCLKLLQLWEGSMSPDIIHTQIHSNTLVGPARLECHWRGPSCTNFWLLKVLPLNSAIFLNGFE